MTTKINSVRYAENERITEQTVTYTKSDDMFYLARLQNQRAQYQRRIEQLSASDDNGINAAEQISALKAEIALCEAEIAVYEEYLKGYGEEDA